MFHLTPPELSRFVSLKFKVHLRTRYLAVVLDASVPITFPFGLHTLSHHGAAGRWVELCAWVTALHGGSPGPFNGMANVASLHHFCVRVSRGSDVRHFHVHFLPPGKAISHLSPSGARSKQMPFFTIRSKISHQACQFHFATFLELLALCGGNRSHPCAS